MQAYPNFDLEIRNEEIVKEGQHGVWDFYSFYGKRLIIFEGIIIGRTEAECHEQKELMSLVTQLPSQPDSSDDGTVVIQWTDPLGRDVEIEAKLSSSINFTRPLGYKTQLNFILQLKSPNPIIEGQELLSEAGFLSWEMGSIHLPMLMPSLIDIVRENIVTVDNGGNVVTNSTIRLYGSSYFPITNPRVTNLTTGKFMQVNVTLADETEFVSMNSKTGEVLDQDSNDLSGSLETGSEFITLNVGNNEIYYTSDESDPLDSNNPVADRRTPDAAIAVEYKESIL